MKKIIFVLLPFFAFIMLACDDVDTTTIQDKPSEKERTEAYVDALIDITTTMSVDFEKLADNLEDSSFTDEWALETKSNIISIEVGIRQARNLELPPHEYEDIHNHFLQAMNHYKKSMDKIFFGIENTDKASLDEGTEIMQTGNEEVQKVVDALGGIK